MRNVSPLICSFVLLAATLWLALAFVHPLIRILKRSGILKLAKKTAASVIRGAAKVSRLAVAGRRRRIRKPLPTSLQRTR